MTSKTYLLVSYFLFSLRITNGEWKDWEADESKNIKGIKLDNTKWWSSNENYDNGTVERTCKKISNENFM